MPIYHHAGQVPRKRHMVFRQPDGALYAEELIGNKGFTGPSSLLYHLNRPTSVISVRHFRELKWDPEPDPTARHRHFRTHQLPQVPSPTLDRIPIMSNQDVTLFFVQPQREDEHFYRSGQGDELIFVSNGTGVLETQMGDLPFRRGDYLLVPRGILHRFKFTSHPLRFLVIESAGYLRTPARYRNEHGQLLEISPYCERDIRAPENVTARDQKGEFRILVKKNNCLTEMMLDHHPFDVVGWDGYYYPWALNIEDFEPRVGRFHLPPPVHQTFEGDGFVVCSFCPRPFDFDPGAIPAPYAHSNVMADEVIYYANSEFMSRKGIELGSITLHPDGLPHGPHPGRAEESIGKKSTGELAVMIDTYRSLQVGRAALDVEDKEYCLSWGEGAN
ncbi:MAG TPA: homogentisate 1,2-dioxygenase [Acidobacteriota bacterium]|nr:homogentisate 1,2-dioxygenase [Acidobacteriota bacterium]